ncbi:MAG: hypothetical protein ABT11_01290 [Novosphingobium sp. SCN 66-18]|nr:MAG: hypothetical protein ABT11_01290 [Novosphingobium sp. SCN 66-18]
MAEERIECGIFGLHNASLVHDPSPIRAHGARKGVVSIPVADKVGRLSKGLSSLSSSRLRREAFQHAWPARRAIVIFGEHV